MTALSVGAVTDWLYDLAQTVCAAADPQSGKQPEAVDGWPYTQNWAHFVIGLSSPPPDVAGTTVLAQSVAVFGVPLEMSQKYVVPCYIDVRIPGNVTQKQARDATEAIFNPFWQAIAANPSLDGLVIGGVTQVSSINTTPQNVGTAAEKGRRQLMTFEVSVSTQN